MVSSSFLFVAIRALWFRLRLLGAVDEGGELVGFNRTQNQLKETQGKSRNQLKKSLY
jgi:hypothetical protein